MGLLSSLRAAPKSATIRTQLQQLAERRAAAEAKLTTAKEAWRQAVLDGTDAEKASARSAVKSCEYDLQELLMQGEALEQLLAETEAAEAAQAAREQWDADVRATRDAWAKTEKLLADYQKHAAAVAATVRALYDVHVEWSDIERRRRQDERFGELIDTAAIPALPGATRRGAQLWTDDHLRYLPRLDEGHGSWYQVTPY